MGSNDGESDERPVTRVTLTRHFWLGKTEITQAQWEYACRAGTTGPYAGNLEAMAWYDANSGRATHPVAQRQPNAWGLFDMHGNVWEWCLDWKSSYPGDEITDPAGASSGASRVLRGAAWY